MKYKHIVMMVILTIISSFHKPFYYRKDYSNTTNQFLKQNHLYPTMYLQPYPELDTFVHHQIPLEQLSYYRFSSLSFSTTNATLTTLLTKYNKETIMLILSKTEKEIFMLSQLQTIPTLPSWLLLPDFTLTYLPRYLLWQQKQPLLSKETVLSQVHKQEDLLMTQSYASFYQKIQPVLQPDAYDALVNKQNFLSRTYIPKDLIHSLRKDCYYAMEALVSQARNQGYSFTSNSRYRSYAYQEALYQYYLRTHTQEETDSFSCKPGFSEHQTGLAIDFAQTHHAINDIEKYEGYPWLKENAHHYGFTLRYPKGKDMITGIHYEPWHFRYIGIELATFLFEMEWTLEEYHELYKDNE